jgi:NADPH-dependent 2,4-dienoyl-CoA reductase/sulfur reductase-like enzyme
MTGPEYAEKYINLAGKLKVKMMTETMVLHINKNREITAINKKGIYKIKTNAIVLAMGCRERTRWNIMIPGSRPSGIYTAGVAQGFINLYNIMPGKNVVILGSGDVGLIMARRLKFEGANVIGVVEILPYASGLPRNVVQCLDDYDTPLYLTHTVIDIKGKDRLEEVTIVQVDENMQPVVGTERQVKCDTLLLSLGLIPENELSKEVGIELDSITGGPIVDQNFETSHPGIFSCGNCMQVYDTVDMLAIDAKKAGKNAANYTKKTRKTNIELTPGKGVRYIVPQKVNENGKIPITLRVTKPGENATLHVLAGKKMLLKKKLPWMNPANMIKVDVGITSSILKSGQDLEVTING